jgi:hypothetical protein
MCSASYLHAPVSALSLSLSLSQSLTSQKRNHTGYLTLTKLLLRNYTLEHAL